MKLLIVEDDRGLANGIAFFMERDGCEVACAGTLAHARKIFEAEKPDAILLDLNLPDGDGMEFCREIRRTSRTPILMLTARDMETDEVQGLLSGADDYLTKPFSLAVLKARLDAVLRRSIQTGQTANPTGMQMTDSASERAENLNGTQDGGCGSARDERALTAGSIRLLPGRMKVFRGEQEIECSATEYRLLCYLLENRGQVLLKEQILAYVWDHSGSFVDENTLQVTIGRLRRKLEADPSNPTHIRTVHGMGYIFVDGDAPAEGEIHERR